jgi:transmembrane sensor
LLKTWNGWSAAATLVVCAVIAAVVTVTRGAPETIAHEKTYTTQIGEQKTVTFDDGSRAVLAPATTVTISHPSRATTVATVRGEALFTVTHSARNPFTVQTGRATVRVLGTTFLVRHYATDRATRVVVADGRVALRSGERGATKVLSSRMLAMVTDSGEIRLTPDVVVDDYTAWTQQRLVFKETPLNEVFAQLSRVYDVEFRLRDSVLATQSLTWRVSVTRNSLSSVVDGLALLLNSHAERSGRVITLVPGARSAPPADSPPLTHLPTPAYGR